MPEIFSKNQLGKTKRLGELVKSAARAEGQEYYETGMACKYGHVAKRRTLDSFCIECLKERHLRRIGYVQEWRRLHPGYSGDYYRKTHPFYGMKVRAAPKKPTTDAQRAKRRDKARKYKARRRAAEGKHSKADVRWLMARQGGRCAICLVKIGKSAWEADHRVALVCGGTDDRANLQISHMRCNRSKGKRDEIEYARVTFGRLL
jgi:5-methylcytosine-specific restriction endonuclease McrA